MYKTIRSQYIRATVNINFYDFIYIFLNSYILSFLCEESEDGQHRKPKHVIDSAAYTAIKFVNTIPLCINTGVCPRNGMS
jgi:hypothetical protein